MDIRSASRIWDMSVKRSESEVESILRESRPRMFRLALAIVADREKAEDVAQEALVKATKARATLRTVDQPWSWLRKILIRCATDSFQRVSDETQELTRDGTDLTVNLAVRITLHRLEPADRVLLALIHFEQLSYEETAMVLDIPVGTVGSRLFAAREAFRKEWQK